MGSVKNQNFRALMPRCLYIFTAGLSPPCLFYRLVAFLWPSCSPQSWPSSSRLSAGEESTDTMRIPQVRTINDNWCRSQHRTSCRKQRSSFIFSSVHSPKNFAIGWSAWHFWNSSMICRKSQERMWKICVLRRGQLKGVAYGSSQWLSQGWNRWIKYNRGIKDSTCHRSLTQLLILLLSIYPYWCDKHDHGLVDNVGPIKFCVR